MTGGVIQSLGTLPPGQATGQILVVYNSSADAVVATTWRLDGGGVRTVQTQPGTAVKKVSPGQHMIVFISPAGHLPPPPQPTAVVAGRLVILKVTYH